MNLSKTVLVKTRTIKNKKTNETTNKTTNKTTVNSTVKVDALEAKTSGANIDINSNLRLRVLTNTQIAALTGMVEGDTVYSSDLGNLRLYNGTEWVNVGTGTDLSIKELAEMICSIVCYEGALNWDTSKPDGTPRKLMNVSKINALGWKAKIGLREGIERVYRDVKDTFG